jgi:hypothetical protein
LEKFVLIGIGIGPFNLGLASYEIQLIINDAAGEEIDPVQKDTVFKQFTPEV